MKVYIKFITKVFLKSFTYVTLVLLSLILILNILSEIEFFTNIPVASYFPIYLAFLNSPSLVFEMFPFIFLLSTQVFFIYLFNNDEIQIFKYSGLKNSQILKIIAYLTFLFSVLIIILFYNFSSSLKSYYLELKTKHTLDGKYLAVITNNGLWIRDVINGQINIINASKIDKNFLIDAMVSEFDKDFNSIRHIKSPKIDIEKQEWVIYEPKIFNNENSYESEVLKLYSNFDYQKIQNLFSNLSSLSLLKLFKLRKNYKLLNYSTTETDIQIHKIISYPIYLTLMTILAAIIMFNTKHFKNTTMKLAIGLFLSVIIYYINNFFYVMGNTEKISVTISIWLPLFFLSFVNIIIVKKINEK
jgi:lipopolysaccharide export system permease protein